MKNRIRRPRHLPALFARRRRRDGEHGQILVMFTLVVVLLMALAAVVIDVGLLRTDTGKLQNALDAGALAAAQSLPVNKANATTVSTVARDFSRTNYPGMPNGNVPDPSVKYACLIGVDGAGLPRVNDMPAVCNVSFAANSPQWLCTTVVCWAPCDPVAVQTDVCNTIILNDNVTRPYTFGRAVNVNSGNSGVISSAACTGLCGNLPVAPVDVVLLLDRTGSMDDSSSVDNLRAGAFSVLQAFDPTLQRIALGFTGPTSQTRTSGGYYGQKSSSAALNACTPAGAYTHTVHAVALDPTFQATGNLPNYLGAYQNANAANGLDDAMVVSHGSGINVGDFLLASITVDDGNNANITTPNGWTLIDRTDNGSNVGVASYYRFATSADTTAGNWTWVTTNNTRAAGIVVRYSGVDPADPINAEDEDANTGFGTTATVTAPSIGTSDGNSALVGVFVANTRNAANATNNFAMTGGNALTERGDIANTGATDGPSIAVGTGSQTNTGNTGTRTATAAASTRWASQLIALHAKPGAADIYGTTYPADIDEWIPVPFTGMDNDTPAVAHHEAYVDANNNPVKSTEIVQAIGCFDVSQVGTNLATPLQMARQYLRDHGRPNVKQGIILETDGTPEHNAGQNDVGDWNNFRCDTTTTASNAVKADKIELFTIGYGVTAADNGGSVPKCPDNSRVSVITQLASMATDSASVGTSSCDATENTDGDHFFCTPAGGDLKGVLAAAAAQLAGNSRLVQLYPSPIVTNVSPGSGVAGNTVTITGKYFTEAYSVTFGGNGAGSFTVVSDTQITAKVPPGPSGQIDVQVSTPGGTSKTNGGDKFTYP